MVLAAANFMGFWDYKWDKPTCPCCLTVEDMTHYEWRK